ncbi:glycosyltransferase [Bremerella cremea]|uniref:glycosyltransferase n=1 Tax=Bremerella cremea TaxID=1031537 RepID=UPI0031EF2630
MTSRSGTEMYVYDLARNLIQRGHRPIVYTPDMGEVTDELRRNSIPVVDRLEKIRETPDVIHGHHTLQTTAALLHFPKTPGIFLCHDFDAWHDTPPKFDRIGRYVAVDQTCADRLAHGEGIELERIQILTNPVDLNLFQPRRPLPEKPKRAVVFSSYGTPESIQPIREACSQQGIRLDAIGSNFGDVCRDPYTRLPQYDLVFAKGRCAREAMAVGCATIYCDVFGMSSLVTAEDVVYLNQLGRRTLASPLTTGRLVAEIQRYNAADAAKVTQYIRQNNSTDSIYGQLINIYEEVIEAYQKRTDLDPLDEIREMARMAEWWHLTRSQRTAGPPLVRPHVPVTFPASVEPKPRGLQYLKHRGKRLWRSIKKRVRRVTQPPAVPAPPVEAPKQAA